MWTFNQQNFLIPQVMLVNLSVFISPPAAVGTTGTHIRLHHQRVEKIRTLTLLTITCQ